MWGARGPFLPEATMAMMVIIGSRLLGHVSLVGIEYSHVAAKKKSGENYGGSLRFGSLKCEL